MTYEIRYTANPSDLEMKALTNGLTAHAKQTIGKTSFEPFGFLIHGPENNLIAGCTGVFMYGNLHIKLLWVDEAARGQGDEI